MKIGVLPALKAANVGRDVLRVWLVGEKERKKERRSAGLPVASSSSASASASPSFLFLVPYPFHVIFLLLPPREQDTVSGMDDLTNFRV